MENGLPIMLMMLAPLASIISIIGVPFLFCQASSLSVPTGPGLMGVLIVGCWNYGGYHESSRVPWWVCHGYIDGRGDGLQDSWWFMQVFCGYTCFMMIL